MNRLRHVIHEVSFWRSLFFLNAVSFECASNFVTFNFFCKKLQKYCLYHKSDLWALPPDCRGGTGKDKKKKTSQRNDR